MIKARTAILWTYEHALSEAMHYVTDDYGAAWVFRLSDGSYGWANCHPSWGWLLDGEQVVACVFSDGSVEKECKQQ